MSATIVNFQNLASQPISGFLFLDTSFLINALLPVQFPGQPTQQNIKCSNFLTLLQQRAQQGDVAIYTCDNVLNEFFNFILKKSVEQNDLKKSPFNTHAINYSSNKKNPATEIFKDHPELVSNYLPLIQYFYNFILSIPIAVLDPDLLKGGGLSISDKMEKLIEDYEIMPSDALNVATALKAGINQIVAIDSDYHRVSEISVYTFLSAKPRSCALCSIGVKKITS